MYLLSFKIMSTNLNLLPEGTPSHDLHELVTELVDEFGKPYVDEQLYTAESGESVWLKFDELGLAYLTTDVTDGFTGLRSILSLARTRDGYMVSEMVGPAGGFHDPDLHVSQFEIKQPCLLSSTQLVELRDVCDELDKNIDLVRLDAEFAEGIQFDPDAYDEAGPSTGWRRRLESARKVAHYELAHLGYVATIYVVI